MYHYIIKYTKGGALPGYHSDHAFLHIFKKPSIVSTAAAWQNNLYRNVCSKPFEEFITIIIKLQLFHKLFTKITT